MPTDIGIAMFGERITLGSWLRHAIDDGYVDPAFAVQIGLRGTGYSPGDFDWIRRRGARVITADQCWYR